jgi:hypothetical protein
MGLSCPLAACAAWSDSLGGRRMVFPDSTADLALALEVGEISASLKCAQIDQ